MSENESLIEDDGQFDTLFGLVEQYSPSGEEAIAVEWLVDRMETLGFTRAFVDETGNAIGLMGTGERQIVLLGHIDTVPGNIPVEVIESLHVKSLRGRGTVDAKGPLAAFVDAVAAIGEVEGWQLVVIGAIDEERESIGTRSIVGKYRPDFAIIGEPSQWNQVTLGYKGSAWAKAIVQRSMTHSAGQAESAAEAAVRFWNQVTIWVEKFNSNREKVFDQVLPTLRAFSSDEDGFKETATLKIGVRLPPDFEHPQWYAKLQEIGSTAGVEINPIGYPISAYRAERNTHLVRAFLGSIRAIGGKPGFVVKTGTADLNIVAPTWECPALAYGPGDSKLDHTPTEHIVLEDFRKGVDVLLTVIKRLTGSA